MSNLIEKWTIEQIKIIIEQCDDFGDGGKNHEYNINWDSGFIKKFHNRKLW